MKRRIGMKLRLVLTGVFLLLICSVCMAANGAGTDEDCPCLGERSSGPKAPEIPPEQLLSEQMEWVCETYRRIVCTDYDSEPCAWCVIPCSAACGFCSGIPDPALVAACYMTCIGACATGCPECEYCVRYEIEETVICGWVLVE
jgi:hypothetical protein